MTEIVTINTSVLLFDLDGTLVDSTAAVEKTWENQVNQHNQEFPDKFIDLPTLLNVSHGSRTVETFAAYFPELKLTEILCMHGKWVLCKIMDIWVKQSMVQYKL